MTGWRRHLAIGVSAVAGPRPRRGAHDGRELALESERRALLGAADRRSRARPVVAASPTPTADPTADPTPRPAPARPVRPRPPTRRRCRRSTTTTTAAPAATTAAGGDDDSGPAADGGGDDRPGPRARARSRRRRRRLISANGSSSARRPWCAPSKVARWPAPSTTRRVPNDRGASRPASQLAEHGRE